MTERRKTAGRGIEGSRRPAGVHQLEKRVMWTRKGPSWTETREHGQEHSYHSWAKARGPDTSGWHVPRSLVIIWVNSCPSKLSPPESVMYVAMCLSAEGNACGPWLGTTWSQACCCRTGGWGWGADGRAPLRTHSWHGGTALSSSECPLCSERKNISLGQSICSVPNGSWHIRAGEEDPFK